MQEHVHTGKVVGGVVDLLAEETILDDMGIEVFFRLKEQRAGACGGVVDLVDRFLFVHGKLSNELRDILGREEFPARFSCVGGIVGD